MRKTPKFRENTRWKRLTEQTRIVIITKKQVENGRVIRTQSQKESETFGESFASERWTNGTREPRDPKAFDFAQSHDVSPALTEHEWKERGKDSLVRSIRVAPRVSRPFRIGTCFFYTDFCYNRETLG